MTALARPLLPLQLAEVPSSLRRILDQEGVPAVDYSQSPSGGRFVLYDSQRTARPNCATDQDAIDVNEIRRGLLADPFVQLDDTTSARTWWQIGPWTASEETARIDKGALRESVLQPLRRQIVARGGVWMRLAPVPHPYRSAFNFRFDHDEFVAEDFAAVMAAIARHQSATTHFVCASPHEQYGATLRRLADCDVGSHGYRHHTYATFSENRLNIARGIETLRKLGFEPNGFVAPHGRYHAQLAAAMASLGIAYSSEFTAAYDDRPHYLPGSIVYQIPIHPVCLGMVLEAANCAAPPGQSDQAAVADAVADYFIATAAAKRAVGEPIFLYGHPDGRLGRYPNILRRLFDVVDGWSDVWQTTLTEFHRWWQARATARFQVYEVAGGYEVRTIAAPKQYVCGVQWIFDEGETAFALPSSAQRVSRETTTYTPHPAVKLPHALRTELPRGWKEHLRRALDWEYVTPIEEIDVGRWQGRLKRSLRRWKQRRRESRVA